MSFSVELSNCDGTNSVATTCTIPVSVLRVTPFNLDWGDSVFAKVYATNEYGDSLTSNSGNGAKITTTSDAPSNLAEVYASRTKSTLGLSWSAPIFKGGDVIIDYRISYAVQGGTFTYLTSSVTGTEYTATGLSFGTTYQFKVEARNSYGYSTFSSTISLLCAF